LSAGFPARGGARYPDSEQGARELIIDMTAFAADSIVEIVPHPSIEGCWIVSFPRRKLRAFVGDHPLAPDFELVKGEPERS
jgi:hypothetical protein